MGTKKKILVLATGGTIASEPGPDGLAPEMDVKDIFGSLGQITGNYDITARDILRLDSSNIQPEEWLVMARSVAAGFPGYDGVVITHGTDTMAYTASILSFMLRNIPVPVVLTGSQLPFCHPLTDAAENIRLALAMAASGVPGVFLAFNRKVMLGCRAVKVRTDAFDAFESVNYPYIARVSASGLSPDASLVKAPSGPFALMDRLCSEVFLIKLTPGFSPDIFEMLLKMRYRGIVIEAFGAGGLHYIHRDLVSEMGRLSAAGIPVVVASQCLYERSDLTLYEVGKRALAGGVISAADMTTEAAVTKLIWTLGQTQDIAEVRRIFSASLCGEISDR